MNKLIWILEVYIFGKTYLQYCGLCVHDLNNSYYVQLTQLKLFSLFHFTQFLKSKILF